MLSVTPNSFGPPTMVAVVAEFKDQVTSGCFSPGSQSRGPQNFRDWGFGTLPLQMTKAYMFHMYEQGCLLMCSCLAETWLPVIPSITTLHFLS